MNSRRFDPHRLEVAAFAADGGRLEGAWPLADFQRLLQDTVPQGRADTGHRVAWSAQGELRADALGVAQTWLRLDARTEVQLACQRCLEPMVVVLEVHPVLRFVASEAEAERLDEDSEEDVLASSRALDLRELIEDELILALPLVPHHARCPRPLLPQPARPAESDFGDEAQSHPFAALSTLKRDPDKKAS